MRAVAKGEHSHRSVPIHQKQLL